MSSARRWVWNDAVFAGVALSLVAFTYTPLADPLNEPLCAVSYSGARALLDALGVPYAADAAQRTLSRGSFSIEVSGLCSGLRGLALWGAVMILLPGPRRQKLVHFALGVAVLMLVNAARIAHLYQLGAGGSPRFALYHEWIWPAAIVGGILFYRLLRLLAGRSRTVEVAHG